MMANQRGRAHIEKLERRDYLSGSLALPEAMDVVSPASTFTVVGTHGNDTVTINDTTIMLNNSVITYPAGSSVAYVDNGGNDSIVVNANTTPVAIYTGTDNDTITLNGSGSVQINTASSGGGSETLKFGAGAAPAVTFSSISIAPSHGQGTAHRS